MIDFGNRTFPFVLLKGVSREQAVDVNGYLI